ncbi:MAG: DUF2062 domain-containing protein [Planctomycetota bacterium]
MLGILSWSRRLGKLVRGDASSKSVFIGALIGALIGMTPGFNLTLLIWILLFFVLAANLGAMVLGLLIGKLFCLMLAPWTFEIGFGLVSSMESVFKFFATAPVLAWMELERYCLIGGLPIAIVIGVAFGIFMNLAVRGVRRSLLAAGDRSERAKKLAANRWMRIVFWIFFGKSKGELSEKLEHRKAPLLRKSGLVFVAIVLVIAIGIEILFAGMILKPQLEHQLTQSFGAEANVASADLSLFTGSLTLKGVQVTDAEAPSQNVFQAEELSAEISFKDLLSKRLVMDHLVGNGIKTDSPRESPGFVLPKPEGTGAGKGDEPTDEETLEDYLETIGKVKGYLEKLKEYLDREKEQTEPPSDTEREKARERARLEGYLVQSARDRLVQQPTITIRRIELGGVEFKDVPGSYKLTANDISTEPTLNDAPMIFDVQAEQIQRSLVNLRLLLNEPAQKNLLELFLPDLDLNAESLTEKAPLLIKAGKALVEGAGAFDSEELYLPIRVSVSDLQAAVRGNETVLGFEASVANRIFESLKSLEIQAVLEGSLLSPRLKVDTEQLLKNLQETLLAEGKAELARLAGEQVAKVKALADEQIDKGKQQLEDAAKKALEDAGLDKKLGDLVPGAKEGLGGLIPGGKKKDDGKEDEKKDSLDPSKVIDDLSKGLPFGKKKKDGDKR